MRIAIMQPYFFPYLGYFGLINGVDLFIVYDTVQYIRRGWINRNRIFHQNKKGWQYINVPIEKADQKTPIIDIRINNTFPWHERLLGQLAHYKNTAPYAEQTINFVRDSLSNNEMFISKLNVKMLEFCSKMLNINFNYRYCSDLDIVFDEKHNAEEKILDLCEFLGAKEYVNLPGGVNLYDSNNFVNRNIKLTFQNLTTFIYDTGQYSFEPNLSIIDLLMWNKPEIIKKYLEGDRS